MSPAPQKKKYISTTNHDGGAAHFGLPSSCTLPITTDAPITLLYTRLTSTHFSNTNLHGRTLFGHPSSLHTFKLPVTTDAPITLSTPLTSTYFSAANHHRGTLFGHAYPLPIYTDAHSSSFHTPLHTPSYVRSTAFVYLSRLV